MSARYVFLLWALVGVTQFAVAQPQDARFTYLTTNEGLSQNNVNCILQDRKGFMWFGTQDGLNKFDGYTYTLYRNDPEKATSLSHSYIHALFEDRQGRLWVGSDNGGLSLFDARTETFINYKHIPGVTNSLIHDKVTAIAQDAQGYLWIGTNGGLDRFDPQRRIFTHFTHQETNSNSLIYDRVTTLLIDRAGTIWVGTEGSGFSRFDPATQSFTNYEHQPDNPQSLSHNRISAFFEDSRGRFWVGTDGGGLNLMDRARGVFTHFRRRGGGHPQLSHDDVMVLAEDNNKTLWIGTQNGGINLLHPDGSFSYYTYNVDSDHGLNNGSIYSLYKDPIGTMWVGTYSGGVNKLDATPLKFKLVKRTPLNINKLTNSNILSIREDHAGNLWLGTDGGGINVLKKGQSRFVSYQSTGLFSASESSNFVLSIYEDSRKRIWIGNYKGGVTTFNPAKGIFEPVGNLKPLSISAIMEARNGVMWLGTFEEGLIRYDKKGVFTRFPAQPTQPGQLNYHTITTLREDSRGAIWIGTYGGGVNVYNPVTNTFSHYVQDSQKSGSISNNQINILFENSSGELWVGTNAGLNKFDPHTHTFTAYRLKDGLANEVIRGILEDNHGMLWLSTNKGLSVFNPKTHSIRNFDASDGLQESSFNRMACFRSPDGQLFFGGLNGLNSFYPDSIHYNRFMPPVYITDFQLFNRSVHVLDRYSVLKRPITETQEITLSYQQSVMSFTFAGLNYTVSEKNRYAYKLEGFDQDWIQAGTKRTATYTHLDPGTYTFRVKASNNDGLWNQKGTTLTIHITPPFWLTPGFKALMAALLLGSLYGIYLLRVSRIKAQQLILQNQVRTRTIQLIQQKQELQEQELNLQLLQAKVEQQAAQQLLLESEQRFQEIAENVDEAFWIHSAQPFQLLYVNAAFERIWQRSLPELSASPMGFLDTVLAEDQSAVEAFVEAYRSGEPGELYCRLQEGQQPLRWLLVRSFIIPAEDGQPLRHIGIASDVTSQKEKEHVLQQSLLREQELNQLKSQFVSTASHEFRTPLTTIQSSVELIKLYLDSPAERSRVSIQKHLGVIEKQISQFGVLLTDVLTIGQIEAGKLTYAPVWADVEGLCRGLIETHFSHRADGRRVVLVVSGVSRRVYLDVNLISHVLENLLSNAFKFSVHGNPVLGVEYGRDELALSVTDRGIGIPSGDLDSLFTAFYRGSNTQGIQGTGLGLVIAREFVARHGGWLRVRSVEGEGSTFTVGLPLRATAQVADRAEIVPQ